MITVGIKIKCTLYSLASKYGAMSATYIHSEPQPWEGEREGITSDFWFIVIYESEPEPAHL